jgi:hypothetical protein
MIKLFALFLILFLITLFKIYKDYKGDKKKAFLDILLFLFLLLATTFSKSLLIYRPLFWIHIFLLAIGWTFYYIYLFSGKKRLLFIISPLFSITAFFILGFFFKE